MRNSILTVLTNYKRPINLPPVVEALASQTVPTDVVIIDNAPAGQSLDISFSGNQLERGEWRKKVRTIFRVNASEANFGPPCRFIPALAFLGYDYIYFHDEDMLPGPRAVEHLLTTAIGLNGEFATIGQYGRRFRGGPDDTKRYGNDGQPRDYVYVLRHVARAFDKPVPVDMTCNSHFVRADLVRHALNMKWDLIVAFGREKVRPHVDIHDDFLLCLGIQRATGWSSWLTRSLPDGGESSVRKAKLKDNDAVCGRPTHRDERTELARMAGTIGWKSLWRKNGATERSSCETPGPEAELSLFSQLGTP